MKAIFVIEAPFQLLGTYEAIQSYDLNDYIIYMRLSNDNKDQLKSLVDILFTKEEQEQIKYFDIQGKNYSHKDYCLAVINLFVVVCKQFHFDYIFLGDFKSRYLHLFVRFIQKSKIIILDDGIKSLSVQNSFTDKYYFNMFTMLRSIKPYDGQKIVYHSFDRLKQISNEKEYQNDTIIFLGSKIVEANIVTTYSYLHTIESLLQKYSDKKVIYIPHRAENIIKLDSLRSKYNNLIIKKINIPIEIFFALNNPLPNNVISFYSAGLVSLKILYENLNIIAIKCDYSLSEYKDIIDIVYEDLNNYKINTVDVDDIL